MTPVQNVMVIVICMFMIVLMAYGHICMSGDNMMTASMLAGRGGGPGTGAEVDGSMAVPSANMRAGAWMA